MSTEILTTTPPPLVLAKQKRKIRRDKYIKTITLFEGHGDERRETKVPATVDAAKVMNVLTAQKLRDRVESALNDSDDKNRPMTPKEYRDLAETLEKVEGIISRSMEAPQASSKPGTQSLILHNSVISTGAPSADTQNLMSMVAAAATGAKRAEIIELEKEKPDEPRHTC
jgi:hypothetical protein